MSFHTGTGKRKSCGICLSTLMTTTLTAWTWPSCIAASKVRLKRLLGASFTRKWSFYQDRLGTKHKKNSKKERDVFSQRSGRIWRRRRSPVSRRRCKTRPFSTTSFSSFATHDGLPRQARDTKAKKHGLRCPFWSRGAGGQWRQRRDRCGWVRRLYATLHGEKTAFLGHLYIKYIILPRQARDKHSENSKTMPFSQSISQRYQYTLYKVRKRAFWAIYV